MTETLSDKISYNKEGEDISILNDCADLDIDDVREFIKQIKDDILNVGRQNAIGFLLKDILKIIDAHAGSKLTEGI